MERLTEECWKNLDPWECCGQDKFCTRGCHDEGGCTNGCIVPKVYCRLAKYEDIGLTPEQIREVDKLYTEKCEELARYKKLEEQGLLLQLPCKVGTQVYMINHYWIDEGFISGIAESDDVDCFCYKVYCDPDDYTMVAVADFNVTWFLTKEEAESALAEMKGV